MRYLHKLTLAICLFSFIAKAQTAQEKLIDSLAKVVANKNTPDTTRAKWLYKLSDLYLYNQPAKALKLAEQSLVLATQLNYPKGIAGANNNLGNYYCQIGDYEKALECQKRALAVRLKMKSILGIGQSYLNINNAYYGLGNYADASKNLFEALKYSELAKNDVLTGMVYADLANVYHSLKKEEEALKYHLMLIKLREKNGDMEGLCISYNNIGTVYRDMGKYDTALQYLQKANSTAVKIKNENLIGYAQSNIGDVYRLLGKYALALVAERKAFETQKELGDKQGMATVAEDMGGIYLAMSNLNEAAASYLKQVSLGKKMKSKKILLEGYEGLAKVFEAKNDFSQALKYHKLYSLYKDSVLNETSTKQVSELQTKYQTAKKEEKITQLNQVNTIQKLSLQGRNKTIAMIIGLFILSGIVVAWLYNRNQFKQKTVMQLQMLKQQEQLAAAVIDAEEKERTRIAADLHDSVGQLFSAVRMNLNGLLDRVKMERDEDRFLAEKTVALVEESCKEVRSLSHQMMPNMLLRSGIASDVKSFIETLDSETLKVSVEANGFKNKLESNVETVLYRVIQESVNNVIKHAKASKLEIILNRDAKGITVFISDDGVGFNTALKEDFDGIGLKNIAARIEYLKGTVSYNSAPGKGTRVNITVPVE